MSKSNIKTPPRLVLPPGLRRELEEKRSTHSDADFIDRVVESLTEEITQQREEICWSMLEKGWGPQDCQIKEIFGINEDNTLRYEVYFVDRDTGKPLTEDQIENGKPRPDTEVIQ